MFYTPHALFIHVPRTGGTWLTDWARRSIKPWRLSMDVLYMKHMKYAELVNLLPPLQDHVSFAIRRDEDERFESYRKLALGWKGAPSLPPHTTIRGWTRVVEAARNLSVDEFRRDWFAPFESYLGPSTMVVPFERDMPLLIKWLTKIHNGLMVDAP